jgi:hypothetical protein
MRQRALIGALGLVLVGVVLGATVFRSDIAQATGLSQSVTVDNTTTNPVPVREQNLDGNGNIKVHEQGTANVNVTNSTLQVVQSVEAVSVTLFAGDSYTVPTGKRLVIQYLNGVSDNPDQILNAPASYFFLGTLRPGTSEYNLSEQVTIYVGPGAKVSVPASLLLQQTRFNGYLTPA